MNIQELKEKSSEQLINEAENLGIENASTLRRQEIYFAILKKTNWKPNKLSVFAGKVDYPNYNFINKIVIRFIMMITKGPTDINNSYEFTNWENVRKFAKELEKM